MAISSFLPAIPTMLKQFSGVPNAQLLIPLAVSAPGLMVALLSPVAGKLTDSYGRRRMLIFATFLYAVCGSLPFLATGLVAIFVLRLGVGIAEAFVLTIVNTLIGDYFEEKGRRALLTIQAIFSPIFGALIVVASGALTEWQWNGTFLVYLLAFPIFLGVLALIHEPDRSHYAQDGGDQLPLGAFLKLCFPFLSTTFFISTIFFVYAIQAGRAFDAVGVESAQRIGFLIALTNMGLPLGGILFAFLKKLNYRGLVLLVLLNNGIGTLAMGLASSETTLVIASTVQQIGAGMTISVLVLWAQSILPPEMRGRGMGLWASAFFLGQFASPVAFSLATLPTGRPLDAFVILGGITIVIALAYFLIGRGKQGT